jgi:excisionase family DNA binding protein
MTNEPPTWPARSHVTSAELAIIADVADRTILREIHRGHLRAVKAGRQWSIERSEAERWLAAYKQAEPAPTHC